MSSFTKKNLLDARRFGIKPFLLQEPPNFRLGDGKFTLQTQKGPVVSQVDKLYKMGQSEYDVVYATNGDILNSYKNMYPECKFVNITSEEYIEMDKSAENYRNLFIKTYNE